MKGEDKKSVNEMRAESMITMRDRVCVDFDTREIYILNEFGMKFVYDESMQDLALVEEEMLKIGSFFINNFDF